MHALPMRIWSICGNKRSKSGQEKLKFGKVAKRESKKLWKILKLPVPRGSAQRGSKNGLKSIVGD